MTVNPVDIKLEKLGSNKYYDIDIADDGDFETVEGFDTSLLIDGFVEQRALREEVTDILRRSGWIGNETPEEEGYEVGSRYWLYRNRRNNIDTKNALVDVFRDAYAWYVPELLKSVTVTGTLLVEGVRIRITLERYDGQTIDQYFNLWENTGV